MIFCSTEKVNLLNIEGQLKVGGTILCVSRFILMAPLLLKYLASLSVITCSYFFGAMFMVIPGISATDGNIVWTLTRSELAVVLYTVSTSHYLH
ncbi:hypothetical protein MKX03_000945 [Papaver bracteatum]|nr:hypothetical protein MKX03_000945 [Papaver bracteatum]